MNSAHCCCCYCCRLNKACRKKDLIQALPLFPADFKRFLTFFFYSANNLLYFVLCSSLSWWLSKHLLRFLRDKSTQKICRYKWHTLWFTSLQQYGTLISTTPTLPLTSQKCLHIQFTDIPPIHTPAPLQKIHVSLISVPKCQLQKWVLHFHNKKLFKGWAIFSSWSEWSFNVPANELTNLLGHSAASLR